MRFTPIQQDRFRYITTTLVSLVTVISVLVSVWLGHTAASRIRAELSERSQTVAAALQDSDTAALTARSQNDSTATYRRLKSRLDNVKQANPDARSVYLMGREGGRLFFYVDSEKPDSQYYSPAGEWYDDGTDADRAMFDTKAPVIEGPVTDEYGTFISGLAPITDASGRVTAVLGIDFASSKYWRDIIFAAAIPLLTGVSIVAILVFFEVIRRRNLQLLALRSELVSVASHELRNPVTGIRWAAESLEKMEPAGSKQLPMIQAIKHSASRLQESTDDILELTHAMNRRTLTQADSNLTSLLKEVFEAQALSASQKQVTLSLDPTWPAEVIIRCDANQIRRVLHNVVGNAIKYTRTGTPVIAIYKQDDTMHHISIVDQGIGIPTDEQDKVFSGFYRASNAVASKVPGTGLGLFLVQAVMKQHGGNVTFKSAKDAGTTIELSLPKQPHK